jgi:hypothetical protein
MKTSKVPKGKDKMFASGGKQRMLGAGDRTKTKYPAEPQKPGQTAQHVGKPAAKRPGRTGQSRPRPAA